MSTAIYLRISEDKLGLELGVDRQRQDCRKMTRQRGWPAPAEFSDNDISASSGKRRPGYLALMAAVRSGEVDRVVVWHQSRLWRNRRERAEGIEILKTHSVTLVAVKGPELDMSSAYGRGIAGLVGEFDSMEAEMISERVTRAISQRAESGLPHRSKRLYGYTADGTATIEPEATRMAAWFAAFLAGQAVTSIAREMGVLPATVRDRLRNLSYAGVRTHKGREYPATWPAIVDRGTVDAARTKLADPSRRTNGGKHKAASLGAGIYSCRRCNKPVYSGTTEGRPSYRCLTRLGGCGRTWHRPKVDGFVEYMLITELGRGDLADLVPVNRPDLDRLRVEATSIRKRLRTLAADYVLLGLDEEQVADGNRSGRARLAQIEAATGETSDSDGVLAALAAHDNPVKLWHELKDHLDRRRAIVAALVTVTLDAPVRGALPRDPDGAVMTYGQRCVDVQPRQGRKSTRCRGK